MGTLEEKILSALQQGPLAFDDLKKAVEATGDEVTEALKLLKNSGYVENTLANSFCWSLVPMKK